MAYNDVYRESGDATLCYQRRMVECEADLFRHPDLSYVVISQTCSTNAMGRFPEDTADGTLMNTQTVG